MRNDDDDDDNKANKKADQLRNIARFLGLRPFP